MFLRLTVSVAATRERVAWVDTSASGCAGKVAGTVSVFCTFHLLSSGAGSKEWVSDSAWGTLAFVGSNFVNTNGILGTLFLLAFIDIHTASWSFVNKAWETDAFGWVRRFALAVDATGKGLTWTLTLGIVLVVHKVRRRTDTLARLDAALVLLTVIVSCALDTGHKAARGVWVA